MKKKVKKGGTLETIEFFVRITKTIIWSLVTLVIGVLFLIFLFSLFAPSFEQMTGNVALIPIKGTISTDQSDIFSPEGVKSQKIVDWIQDADEDEAIKAIVLEIDSPGGSPVASYEIAHAVKAAEKPTIALIRERGASGGFWVATAADTVFANPMSITGSIGVIGSYVEFAGLIQRYNMTYRQLIAGEHKDALSKFKELTPQEASMFQQKLNKLHNYFITEVAENRNMERYKVVKDADGFIMLGVEAKEKGYVDFLGGREEVKEFLNETLEIDVKFKEYKGKAGFFNLMNAKAGQIGHSFGKGFGASFEEEISMET